MDRETISAIHDEKFETFLNSINVYGGVVQGKYKCKFCGTKVSLNNIYTIFPEEKTIKFVCDNTECVVKFGEYLNGANR